MKQLKGKMKHKNDPCKWGNKQIETYVPVLPGESIEDTVEEKGTLMGHDTSVNREEDLGRMRRARWLEFSGKTAKEKRAMLSKIFGNLQNIRMNSKASEQLFYYSVFRGSQAVL